MNIKKIIIIILFSVILVEVYYIIIAGMYVPAMPDEEMKKAMEFLDDEEYIGMTVEECEKLLEEDAHEYSENCVFVNAGTYCYLENVEFILLLYLDDEGKVFWARLEGVG